MCIFASNDCRADRLGPNFWGAGFPHTLSVGSNNLLTRCTALGDMTKFYLYAI